MDEYIERTEELMLAMNAGARAIENTKRYHGAVYTKDVFAESPQEIPYLQAAKVLREVSDDRAADVAPVINGRWISKNTHGYDWVFVCSNCGYVDGYPFNDRHNFCPRCGAKMEQEDL